MYWKIVKKRVRGFTLSELLIALAILGVIATFTIPKVLQSQQDGKYKAIAKESAGFMSAAFDAYKFQNGVKTSAKMGDLTPYLNYVAVDTTTTVDNEHGDTPATWSCSAFSCYKLHNGAMLYFGTYTFGGSGSTNGIWFNIDPDGKVTDGTTNGPGKSLALWLHYNGQLKDRTGISPSVCDSSNCYTPNTTMIPAWFSWN